MASINGKATEWTPNPDRERRLYEILAAYFDAVESGQSPDRQEWLARYPDLAEKTTTFLDDQDRLLKPPEPLRPIEEKAAFEDSSSALAPTLAVVAEGLLPDPCPRTEPAHGSPDDPSGVTIRYLGD